MALLTDRTLATGVTLQDLIHIVITGDTTDNPAGSSYKATIQQVGNALSGSSFNTYVTGGTYSAGTATFTNNIGGSFDVTGFTTNTNLGNVLYVSENGDDSIAQKGDLHKPWRNLYAAKSASTSGDTVYVLPGTWTYDNTNAALNPYNGQVDTLVNLWKDGVTYYFSPNTKINFINETSAGADMYLFSPGATTGETCTVLGHLEFEQTGLGADTSNGANLFYFNNNSSQGGSTFYAEVKKLTSNHCTMIYVESTNNPTINVTITSEEEYWDYLGGQTRSGSFYFVRSLGGEVNFKSHSKYRDYVTDRAYAFYFRQDLSNSTINVSGEVVRCARQLIYLLFLQGEINININDVYYGNAYTPSALLGSVLTSYPLGVTDNWVLNLNGNLYDLTPNSYTTGIFYTFNNSYNGVINHKGNITTNTSSGSGRFIVNTGTNANNVKININGDINFVGTGTTTSNLFQVYGTDAIVNYRGNITGNFATGIGRPRNGGIVNINSSFIESNVDGATSSVFTNNSTSLGTGRLNNSYVRLTNNTNGVIDGEDNNIFVNNSNVINLGTGSTIAFNTTNNGDLQILNSTLISSYSGATSILYNGTTSVISSNVTVSNNYNITDLKGSITTLTDLTY